jgi:mono/diheme cytochrome c family protein
MLNITEFSVTKLFLGILSVLSCSMVLAGDSALPGHHPLSQVQAGSLLMSDLRCAACHTGVSQVSRLDKSLDKTAPDLAEVGARVTPEFLRSFLASPSTSHPGTTMPDLLASKSESEKQTIAEALTHFLIAQSLPANPRVTSEPIDRQQGDELFHSIGCVACHGPKEIAPEPSDSNLDEEYDEFEEDLDPVRAARKLIKPSVVGLSHVSAKYTIESLSEFLFQPLKVRSSGHMPDMKLTPTESFAIAGYLVGEQKPVSEPLVPRKELVEAGKAYFRTLNCAACHSLPGYEAAPVVSSLKTADLTEGCLSDSVKGSSASTASSRSPRFQLEANQISAISAAIQAKQFVESDNDFLAMSLTAYRCINCHVRDQYGGVHDAHNAYFKGSQLNLGDDGRIPPPLTLMGAKLQPTWMKKVLFDGETVRHYMATRMPQYGTRNLQYLPDLFRRLDVLEGPDMKIPSPEFLSEEEREKEKLIRAAGRELLGDKGANCVACHNFNGKSAGTDQGLELLTSNERLQPAWFRRYIQNPGAFRPRTVMPTAWPDGVAAFTKILDGDTDRQIEAIWYYLSLGTSAADPSGIRAVNTKLTVGDTPVIHRGRSRVAGFRGVAVGLPEKLSYAFNAETGTLSTIWEGEFVNINWSGQGSGDFNPASQSIELAQDVSFAVLEDENAPWPLLPVMTKEAPANSNPLYPKNVGYQFRGYYLDELLVPTFQYRSGSLEIEDRTVAIGDEGNRQLKRVLQFDTAIPQTIWFRAFVGDVRQESEQVFVSDRLRLTVPLSETRLRSLSGEPKQLELLLRLQIPQGRSTLELQYELLKK